MRPRTPPSPERRCCVSQQARREPWRWPSPSSRDPVRFSCRVSLGSLGDTGHHLCPDVLSVCLSPRLSSDTKAGSHHGNNDIAMWNFTPVLVMVLFSKLGGREGATYRMRSRGTETAVAPVGACRVRALRCAVCCAGASSSSRSPSQLVEGKSGAGRLCPWPSAWGQSPQLTAGHAKPAGRYGNEPGKPDWPRRVAQGPHVRDSVQGQGSPCFRRPLSARP